MKTALAALFMLFALCRVVPAADTVDLNVNGGVDGWQTSRMIMMRELVKDNDGTRDFLTTGPMWWLDTNHGRPGTTATKDLHLLYFMDSAFLKSKYGVSKLDFRGGKVTGLVKGVDVKLKGASLVFWIQGRYDNVFNNAKSVNFALVSQPLDAHLSSG